VVLHVYLSTKAQNGAETDYAVSQKQARTIVLEPLCCRFVVATLWLQHSVARSFHNTVTDEARDKKTPPTKMLTVLIAITCLANTSRLSNREPATLVTVELSPNSHTMALNRQSALNASTPPSLFCRPADLNSTAQEATPYLL